MVLKSPEYRCPRCKDRGFTRTDVPFGHPHFGKSILCQCKEEEIKATRQMELLQISGLLEMEQYYTAAFETFDKKQFGVLDAYKQAQDFARHPMDTPHRWLILTGPRGCGKTHLAYAIARARIEMGQTVYFSTIPDLLDYFRDAYHPEAEQIFADRYDKVITADLVILDDLGAQKSSSWAEEKLFQIINYRYNRAMWTVITSNQMHLVGVEERIKSRMSDRALAKIIIMDKAEDYRKKKQIRYMEMS